MIEPNISVTGKSIKDILFSQEINFPLFLLSKK